MRPHRSATAFLAIAAFLVLPALEASGQSITPPTYSATMTVGQTITINKTITLGADGANLVDLFFLADNTGSMRDIVDNAQAGASQILGAVPSGADYNFGVGSYLGDPSESGYRTVETCNPALVYYLADCAYTENAALSSSAADAQAGINEWFAYGGADWPEANLYALEYVAENAGWRTGSQRIVVWFGDASGHELTTTEAEAIAALQAAGVEVIAFNSLAANFGIDHLGIDPYDPYDPTIYDNQASDIVAATGGSLTNNFSSLTASQFVTAVNNQIDLSTSTLDLIFGTSFFDDYTGGLEFSFECTDSQGCTGVGGGESRTFDLHITATEVGEYDFSVFARGVSAEELDHIRVTSNVVPEPATVALLGTGLLCLGFVGWKRKGDEEEV